MKSYKILIEAWSYYGSDKQKISNIKKEDIETFKELIIEIRNKKGYNWTNATELISDKTSRSGWTEAYKVFSYYPNINKNIIKRFMKYCPNGEIDKIENIKFLETKEINIF